MTFAEHGVAADEVDLIRCLQDDGTTDPRHDPHLGDAELVGLYRQMLLSRTVDQRLLALQRQGRIGFHIGCSGEEAAILGAAHAMTRADWVFPSYREFGAGLLRGMTLRELFDQMCGNGSDLAKGRQLPGHFTFRAGRIMSISSPVGTQLSHAVGLTWAAKIRGDNLSALVYFGEGTTSTGEFHCAMNFAGVFRVATIFLCRNNGWAISTPAVRQTATATFAEKSRAYGITGLRCDGNDLLAVVWATRHARDRAQRDQGPTLIEAVTYRLGGHSSSDDGRGYRSEEEVTVWRNRDPLRRLRAHLERRRLWKDDDELQASVAIADEIDTALAEAERAAPPSRDSMFDDVYAELPWHLREQRHQLRALRAQRREHGQREHHQREHHQREHRQDDGAEHREKGVRPDEDVAKRMPPRNAATGENC